jgi:hypothetical protein
MDKKANSDGPQSPVKTVAQPQQNVVEASEETGTTIEDILERERVAWDYYGPA